jgi:hypothetical protein
MITAAIGTVTLGAHGTRRAQATTSEQQPWSFAPNPVAAGGECALVKSSVSPTDDKKQVRVMRVLCASEGAALGLVRPVFCLAGSGQVATLKPWP